MLHQMFLYSETDGFSNGCPWKGNLLAGNHTVILLISSSHVSWWKCFCESGSDLLCFIRAASVIWKSIRSKRGKRKNCALWGQNSCKASKGRFRFFIIRGKSDLEIMWLQSLETELNFGAPFLVMLVWIQKVLEWEN